MNSQLALGKSYESVDIEEIKEYVAEDKSEFVMISGGEPTCTEIERLHNLFDEIKSWGCKISLSTNGTHPEILAKIIIDKT